MNVEELQPPTDDPDQLDLLRDQIDVIDQQIVALVSARTALALAIGAEKERRGIPIFVPGRETEVVENYMQAVPEGGPMSTGDAVILGETVMRIGRRVQNVQRQQAARAAESMREELAALAEQAVPQPGA